MIKVIAIDDEPLALMQLSKMIEMTPYFSLVASCSSAFEAMRVMEENDVDAIFADINMPDLSGLDFIRSLASSPIVVFTTAYSQYAVDGYKVNAVDYLLKPFGQPEFQTTASKVKKMYDLLHNAIKNDSQDADGRIEGDILFVKVDYRLVKISVNDIRYIEAQSEYLRIHVIGQNPLMVLMSIKRMSEILPNDRFVRIHRSYIVNMAFVKEIARMRVTLTDDIVLPIGESYKDDTQKFINDRLIGR